jgi:hypothetical protein
MSIQKYYNIIAKHRGQRYGLKGNLHVQDGCCYQYSLCNSSVGGWKDKNLVLCVGSLAIGKVNPFNMFGNPDFEKFHEFLAGGKHDVNGHCWLQDSNGRIYDIVTVSMVCASCMEREKLDFQYHEIIAGMTVGELAKKGLHYVRAPEIAEKLLLQRFEKLQRAHELSRQ